MRKILLIAFTFMAGLTNAQGTFRVGLSHLQSQINVDTSTSNLKAWNVSRGLGVTFQLTKSIGALTIAPHITLGSIDIFTSEKFDTTRRAQDTTYNRVDQNRKINTANFGMDIFIDITKTKKAKLYGLLGFYMTSYNLKDISRDLYYDEQYLLTTKIGTTDLGGSGGRVGMGYQRVLGSRVYWYAEAAYETQYDLYNMRSMVFTLGFGLDNGSAED